MSNNDKIYIYIYIKHKLADEGSFENVCEKIGEVSTPTFTVLLDSYPSN